MNAVRLLPIMFSALLLAAHFLRAGIMALVILSLLFPLLLLTHSKWASRLVQLILLLGALEWIRTTLAIIDERRAAGVPWTTAAIILGLVAVLTAASALVLYLPALRDRYSTRG
jgi:hypothetical protein